MPNWKKVVTSGSDAHLNSLYAPHITGSLLGTASYVPNLQEVTDQGNTTTNLIEMAGARFTDEVDYQGNNIIDLADVTFRTGGQGGTLRTGTSNADLFVLQAYDLGGGTYQNILEVDAGNNPHAFLNKIRTITFENLGTGTEPILHAGASIQRLDVTGSLDITDDIYLEGALYDSTNTKGSSGMILTSEVGGIEWRSGSEFTVGTASYVDWANIDNVPTYDNYQYWNLKTNGVQRKTIQSTNDVDFVAGDNVTIGYSAGGVVTINAVTSSGGGGGGDSYDGWKISLEGTFQENVASGSTVNFAAGNDISLNYNTGTDTLTINSAATASAQVMNVAQETAAFNVTSDYQHNTYVRCGWASTTNVTIEPDSTINRPIGTVYTLEQSGAGIVRLAAGTGVTINGNTDTGGQYEIIQAIKTGGNTWTAIGGV